MSNPTAFTAAHLFSKQGEGAALAIFLCDAPPEGFEPSTLGVEIQCSVQLSYEGMLASH